MVLLYFILEDKDSAHKRILNTFFEPLCTIPSVEQVQTDLITVVNRQENKLVYVRNIVKSYEIVFGRTFPYDVILLNKALECLDKPMEVCFPLFSSNTKIYVWSSYTIYNTILNWLECPKLVVFDV